MKVEEVLTLIVVTFTFVLISLEYSIRFAFVIVGISGIILSLKGDEDEQSNVSEVDSSCDRRS